MIAAMCLAGKIAAGAMLDREYSIKSCVQYADALLKELDIGIRDRSAHYERGRNEALEEAAQLVEPGHIFLTHDIANAIRALKKSEVKMMPFSVANSVLEEARAEERAATEREIMEWLRAPLDDGGDWFKIYRDLADAIERGEYRK